MTKSVMLNSMSHRRGEDGYKSDGIFHPKGKGGLRPPGSIVRAAPAPVSLEVED
jgi:hypothetical protein